jgi:hypothetical protein
MDKVAEEIESMTETELPLGQRLLKAGFKAITMAGLRERFAIDSLNASLNGQDEAKAVAACLARHNLNPKRTIVDSAEHLKSIGRCWVRYRTKGLFGFSSQHLESSDHTYTRREARVAIDPLASYIGDAVPERVIGSMGKAVALGLDKSRFKVAYPVVESIKQPDPILLYPWPTDADRDGYLEIDMWE